jgi:predicted glycogen debranching enzyme
MIPNRFPDSGEVPEYNTIDATLWFFNAIYKYYRYTHDKIFIRNMLAVLRDIVDWHYKGTRFHIHVDTSDELLSGGHEGVQLTWMDAKIDQWVVTPRRGKAVEINALWYNALKIMEFFMSELHYHGDAEFYHMKANLVARSFNEKFWNPKEKCLYDYIEGDFRSEDIRPNQLYAIGLPFKVLEESKALQVIQVVRKHLLTPRGLRSLSPSHSDYKGRYYGNVWERDSSYHQGPVWSHLTGIYIDALFATLKEDGRDEAALLLNGFARPDLEPSLRFLTVIRHILREVVLRRRGVLVSFYG